MHTHARKRLFCHLNIITLKTVISKKDIADRQIQYETVLINMLENHLISGCIVNNNFLTEK